LYELSVALAIGVHAAPDTWHRSHEYEFAAADVQLPFAA
jgi:hypothetical protein